MGFAEYFQDTPEDIIRQQIENSADPALAGITLEDVLAAGGSMRMNVPESPRIHYEDLQFGTATGRAEFYTEQLAPFGEALPVYKDDYEASPRHALARK